MSDRRASEPSDGVERRHPTNEADRRETERGKVVRTRGPIIYAIVALCSLTALCAVGALIYSLVAFGGDESQRINDLRQSCERASIRNAATVNLDWTYYLSEKELVGGKHSAKKFQRTIAMLSPGERRFLLALVKSNPSRRILEVRAQADYSAAMATTRGVQATDVGLVHLHTPLGSGRIPRRWVRQVNYSCTRAYR